MKKMNRMWAGSVLGLSSMLMGCEQWKADGTLSADRDVELVQKSNQKTLQLDTAVPQVARIEYSSGSKKLTLTVGSSELVFRNATVVENSEPSQTISSAFDQSGVTTRDGQGAGLSVTQNLVCDPECESVREWRETRSCVRNGSMSRVRDRAFNGYEIVAVREVTRRYDVLADLVAERYGRLAGISGTSTQVRRTERVVSICN
jgi:hypothetical protein